MLYHMVTLPMTVTLSDPSHAKLPIFMVALWNRADHYIFALVSFFLCSFFFFPRLISAVADWMSAILPHGVALVRI